ncbi:MAG TPA: hypothetical protein VG650_01270 [Mycobacteriales bacterium]|nr:hypothetical protein [Mycobacteriales bacterium]
MSWSWPLFAWGTAVGVVGVGASYCIGRVARLGVDQRRAYAGLLVMSLVVAVAAAASGRAAFDVGFTVFVVVANFAVPLALLSRVRQPAATTCRSEASCDATACATCPLGARM